MSEELLVETKNPSALDKTLNQMGGVVGQDSDGKYEPVKKDTYAVRSMSGDIGYLEFAIKNQGYGKVVGKRKIA